MTIHAKLGAARQQIAALNPEDFLASDLADLARSLADCDAIVSTLGDLADQINDELAARMDTDQVPVDGLGVLVRSERKSKRWVDPDRSREQMFTDARTEVARMIARDRFTGEVNPALRGVANETFDLVTEVFSIGEPKAAFRRRLGLNPAEYRETATTGYRVTIDTGEAQR